MENRSKDETPSMSELDLGDPVCIALDGILRRLRRKSCPDRYG